jgi:hypothetical protein
MHEQRRPHPIAGVPGAAAVAVWSFYVLLAASYLPDVRPSVLTIGFFGLLACLAVCLNFARWRLVVILASSVHLSFYAIQVVRMVAMTSEFKISALLSALSFYYSSSWSVTVGMLQERGVVGGLIHGFLEFAMPVLSLALIGVTLISWRSRRRDARAR